MPNANISMQNPYHIACSMVSFVIIIIITILCICIVSNLQLVHSFVTGELEVRSKVAQMNESLDSDECESTTRTITID